MDTAEQPTPNSARPSSPARARRFGKNLRQSPAVFRRLIHKKAVRLRNSWRADYVLFLWSLPVVMVFIPPTRDAAREGFRLLSTEVPPWYIQLGAVMVGSIYGLRKAAQLYEMKLKTRAPSPKKEKE